MDKNNMTPEQKLKLMVLVRYTELYDHVKLPDAIDADNIDAVYKEIYDEDDGTIYDAINEVRSSGEDTGLQCGWSRHYESKAVAAQALDGSWIGWTYWYGGGKHGEPEAVDWMEEAYDLVCKEEEKLVVVRTFTKA